MRTTLDLNEDLLSEAQKATGAPTKTAVIELGLRILIERAARQRLVALQGRLPGARAPRRRQTQ